MKIHENCIETICFCSFSIVQHLQAINLILGTIHLAPFSHETNQVVQKMALPRQFYMLCFYETALQKQGFFFCFVLQHADIWPPAGKARKQSITKSPKIGGLPLIPIQQENTTCKIRGSIEVSGI